jgi:4-amino-4-deoxy-L-arabinose transferase-like glycosyltransferase
MRKKLRRDPYLIGVMLLATFFCIINIYWWHLDKAAPPYDEAYYLQDSDKMLYGMQNNGILGLLDAYKNSGDHLKAPLLASMALPFYLIFGNSYPSALLVNLLFIYLLSFYLYKLVLKVSDGLSALLAVAVFNTMPLVFGMSRRFMAEYGLCALVAALVFYLLESDSFREKRWNYAVGIVLGLGMLMKISFFIYVAGPVLFSLYKRRKDLDWSLIIELLKMMAIALAIAATWYSFNLFKAIDFAFSASFGITAASYSYPFIEYLRNLVLGGTSIFYFAAFAISVFLLKKSNAAFLLSWLIIPVIILLAATTRDIRFMMPVFIPIACIIGISVALLRRKWLIPLIFIVPLVSFISISFVEGVGYARVPGSTYWRLPEVADFIGNGIPGHPCSLVMHSSNYFSAASLSYYSKHNGNNGCYLEIFPFSKVSMTYFKNYINRTNPGYLIFINYSSSGYSVWLAEFESQVREYAIQSGEYEESKAFDVSNGAKIELYKKK